MKNVIELLSDKMVDAALRIENELKETYDIANFKLEISSLFFRYSVQCTDAVNDFVVAYNDDFTEVMDDFKKQLTPRSAIAKAKIKKAERLIAEASNA